MIGQENMNEAAIQAHKLTAFRQSLDETRLAFSEKIKENARKILAEIDFPTTRTEAWKYTRVGRIAAISAAKKTEYTRKLTVPYITKNATTFVFENGIFRSDLSFGEVVNGLTIKPLSSCTAEELQHVGSLLKTEGEVFNALNTLYATDGLYIHIADHAVLTQAIQFIHILTGENTVANTRNIIECGKFSQANLIIGCFSEDATASFNNLVSEIIVGENAQLTVDKLQCEGAGNFSVLTEEVQQDKDATFTINTLTLDGTFVRNNLTIAVNGVNGTSNLNGVYVLKDNQHVDNHTVVDHRVPHCQSNELYKGVIDERATAVFNGKVFVRKDAQKINAFQSNGNVLLSDSATANSKPELEIYADDVKCSHGSTVGQLDEEAVFYLRARGISEQSARHLMVAAFIGDVLEKIENEDVLSFAQERLGARFGWQF